VLEVLAGNFRKAAAGILQLFIVDRAGRDLAPARNPALAKSEIAIVNQQRLRRRIGDLARRLGHGVQRRTRIGERRA
jgi:hypothetical protein